MDSNLILSIIIPTKNRYQYLEGALSFLNKTERNDFEVVIQDNSDNSEIVKNMVNRINNPLIKYYYSCEKLSQTENSELALSHSSGEYVCFIGDDDSICNSIFDLADEMKKHNIDSCTYNIPQYNWEDLVDALPNLNYLIIDNPTNKIKKYNAKKILKKYLKIGMWKINDMPRVYHGMVRKKLLDKIKSISGSYFPGPSPDMANATAVALYSQSHYHIDVPMIVSGYGKNSAGGMGRMKLHRGSLKNNFQLRSDVEDNWDSKIPKLWLQSTIYPASSIQSLKQCGEINYLRYMNYGAVYFECIRADHTSKNIVKSLHPTIKDRFNELTYIIYKVLNKLFTKKRKKILVSNRMSIEEALDYVNELNSSVNIGSLFDKVE